MDRPYIDAFIAQHQSDIHGKVLEVLDDRYTRAFGGNRVSESHIVDINRNNRRATVIADLGEPGSLPANSFDCFVLTQTLQFIRDINAGLENAWQALVGEGVILLSMPVTARVDPTFAETDVWRLTPVGLEHLLHTVLPEAEITVVGYGNLLTNVAFLLGLAAEDLREKDYRFNDPSFPLVACARLRKPD